MSCIFIFKILKPFDLIIIGAGAAGLMAAGRASELGARVLVVERNKVAGRKLLITGKGRCNITNDAEWDGYKTNIFPDPKFFRHSFIRFGPAHMVELLERLGLETKVERGGRIFPQSDKSLDVVQCLENWARRNKCEFLFHSKALSLVFDENSVRGVLVQDATESFTLHASNILLSGGGKSYPATGSDGSAYRLAQGVGHSVTQLHPALVPLETQGDIAAKLQGLSLRNVSASLWVNGKKTSEEFGEMIFTHFGLSGPIILTLSRQAAIALRENKQVEISIDLKPALDEKKLDTRLLRDLNENGNKKMVNLVRQWLPATLGEIFLEINAIDSELQANQMGSLARRKLMLMMKNFRFRISGHRPFKEAIITAGGIPTNEIDPKTMQSKLMKGLFIAGEMLDLDANTGGFNLQIAWSTGWVAGEAATAIKGT